MDFESKSAQSISVGISIRQGGLGAMTPREILTQAYEELREVIYRHIVAVGIEPAVAEELTQEAFLKLYGAIRKGTAVESFRAWLLTVSSRMALNHIRAGSYRPRASEEEFVRWLDTRADPGATPEAGLLNRERTRAMRRAYEELSAQQQICLHLRIEGFRYREIARIVGVSVPTVSEYLRRAIARMRDVIHE